MTTAGTYVEANGLRVYYEVYGEDEVLGRPGVSEESGRFNSTVYGLRRAGYRARPSAAAWLTSRSRSRSVKCRSGKGKAIAYHVVPDGTRPLLRDEKDLSGVLALFRLA